MPIVTLPSGRTVFLVDREQLRFTQHGRTASIPHHLMAVMRQIPPTPQVISWNKNHTVSYPILGNSTVGDCFYADILHHVITFLAQKGKTVSFNEAQVIARYKVLSGGDNGLDDSTVFPEWKSGVLGPNGPYKILDEMTIKPTDLSTIALCMWAFCGLGYTASLLSSWLNNDSPGATWDAGSRPDPSAGHAMHLSSFDQTAGIFSDETWALNPPINLTVKGMQASDPEIYTVFSLDMFDANGIAPCGANYDQLAALWQQLGGQQLPASPFPPAPPLDWLA